MRNRNYFVTGSKLTSCQRNVQSFRATAYTNAVLHADERGELGFKLVHLFAEDVTSLLEHAADGFVDLGLVREVLGFRVCAENHSIIFTWGTYTTHLPPFC